MSQSAIVDPVHPELRAALDLFAAWIEYRLAYWSLPGIAIAVVHDQQLVWARAFGEADVDRGIAATPTTRYRIGSVTKLFTATAVMQLRDAGALTLDDPVARHLPWFKIPRGHDHAGGITQGRRAPAVSRRRVVARPTTRHGGSMKWTPQSSKSA